MGLLNFLKRLFGVRTETRDGERTARRRKGRRRRLRLPGLRYPHAAKHRPLPPVVQEKPYAFAQHDGVQGFFDLSTDFDLERLAKWNLPEIHTPEQLAKFVNIPLGDLGWLAHRYNHDRCSVKSSHYHHRWLQKRSGNWRLIESPKPLLRDVQYRILDTILNRVPPHAAAHGFVQGRSILTNAQPHAGAGVLLKFDLENFYPSVSFNRVTAIFRTMGYSREIALWLAKLVTAPRPWDLKAPKGADSWEALAPYTRRSLPQGAPTSPAMANLSAFSLDVRLAGLAECYGATYTRYADDLTISGPRSLLPALRDLIPWVTKIIGSERFRVNRHKRRVVRNNQRQIVTGVVVNERPNISRKQFDELKAILTNCVRHGPTSQNREGVPEFHAHLRGRVAHVAFLNPNRGGKLQSIYDRIDWTR